MAGISFTLGVKVKRTTKKERLDLVFLVSLIAHTLVYYHGK